MDTGLAVGVLALGAAGLLAWWHFHDRKTSARAVRALALQLRGVAMRHGLSLVDSGPDWVKYRISPGQAHNFKGVPDVLRANFAAHWGGVRVDQLGGGVLVFRRSAG